MFIRSRRLLRAASASTLVFTSALLGTQAVAEWTTFSLPPLAQDYASYRTAHLADGNLVYASNDDLDLQTNFKEASLVDYANAGTWYPSDVAVRGNVGAIGNGAFVGGTISLFDPANVATAFTPIAGVNIQNYSLEFRDAQGLYVGGANATETTGFGKMHSLSYVSLDGAVNKLIIDNISMFSGDFAVDVQGNLLVTDDDDNRLYRFTPAQIDAAISGAPLSITDGEYVTTLAKTASLAVDGLGRIWSAGFEEEGIDVFDPANGVSVRHYPAGGAPGADNPNYVVDTFIKDGESYVSYLNASGASKDSTLTYGYEKAVALVPEPTSAMLLASSALFLVARRRKRVK
ncbi:MAG: PEP-CTERM sorting domain-containing protein [Chthoniobacteraceae bacterium]